MVMCPEIKVSRCPAQGWAYLRADHPRKARKLSTAEPQNDAVCGQRLGNEATLICTPGLPHIIYVTQDHEQVT